MIGRAISLFRLRYIYASSLLLTCVFALCAATATAQINDLDIAIESVLTTSPVSEPTPPPPIPIAATAVPATEASAELIAEPSPAQDAAPTPTPVPTTPTCARVITANVLAFDQIYTYNRFGAFNPVGMVYALKRDTVSTSNGGVQLKPGKRARPIVLRANEGDCIDVTFTNLLTPSRTDKNSTMTRHASIHVNGLDYVGSITSDGADVGTNVSRYGSSLAASGETKVYRWYAAKQGQYLLYSMGAPAGAEGDNGQAGLGLFGSLNVEPKGSKWYRSQVTAEQLQSATIGTNPNGTPKINYEAVGADGVPVLNMLNGNEIVHTDLNAVITDPSGALQENCKGAPPSGTCGQPFREFTVLFHDEIKAIQAFQNKNLDGTPRPCPPGSEEGECSLLDEELFHGVRDGFAVNYGASGLGSILLANRMKTGPSKDCGECKFEDFFLESWVNGDPALNVKASLRGGRPVALFPDDPSNVHHSYLNDPVRFRNLHIGKETHVFHLHAHQWLQSPRDQNSTYLDSQTISPGGAFTYEINYGGSGNRNLTPGDAIFHCHLYPHFAQGMWELWRNHDVFEAGTRDRNLPDAEITSGVPTPAIVPLPYQPMPPMPTADFRGYPFFVAAQAGHRPPQPPLDIEWDGGLPRHRVRAAPEILDGIAAVMAHRPALLNDPVAARVRAQSAEGDALFQFARDLIQLDLVLLNHAGEPAESAAMKFHEGLFPGGFRATKQFPYPSKPWQGAGYPSFTALGASGTFYVNGRTAVPGAPFADPCEPNVPLRTYRAAYVQLSTEIDRSMKVNRAKWHDRQARIMVLEEDVFSTLDGTRKPEPLFFRANSNDCINFKATNIVPGVLNLDDFQIYTPTDTIGQHIHLVKFDVTSSDGAGNGFNYEDGTFAAEEVVERIEANNHFQEKTGGSQFLKPVTHPNLRVLGAQTTVQRWWADPLVNQANQDRTINTVFTHDHFGPSSHQHHGMYGALVVEPEGTIWKGLNNQLFYTRADGGPTSYAANIIYEKDPKDPLRTFREFNLAFADFAIVYRPDLTPVNPPGRMKAGLPIAILPPDRPEPEAISADDPGTQLINYRNEPIPLRVGRMSNGQFVQKTGAAGDLAYAFSSRVHNDPFTPLLTAYEGDRTIVRLIQGAQEEQHVFNLHGFKWLFEPASPNSGYRNAQQIGISEHFEIVLDPIQRVANDPTLLGNGFSDKGRNFVDHLYSSAATDNLWDGQWGILRMYQGVQNYPIRMATPDRKILASAGARPAPSQAEADQEATFIQSQDKYIKESQETRIAKGDMDAAAPTDNTENPDGADVLAALPNNPDGLGGTVATTTYPTTKTDPTLDPVYAKEERDAGAQPTVDGGTSSSQIVIDPTIARALGGDKSFAIGTDVVQNPFLRSACPQYAPPRQYNVSAYLARDLLPNGELVYNTRVGGLKDPNAILFVEDSDVAALRSGSKKPEPLILRAAAGDCVSVTLTNRLPTVLPEQDSWNLMPMIVNRFNFNQVRTSNRVGLHPQLVSFNPFTDDGASVGFNNDTLTAPNTARTYTWYAGNRILNANGYFADAPVEFGATNLRDMGDAIKHSSHGAIGSLMIEPLGSTWSLPIAGSKATADVSSRTASFREFVVHYQDDLSLRNNGQALRNIGDEDDSEDSGMKGFNYSNEPFWARLGLPVENYDQLNDFDLRNILNSSVYGDPQTPVFTAVAGTPVRFRVLHPAGHARQHGFTVFGHHWQLSPWTRLSTVQGFNPFSFEIGSESGIGPTRHVNILTNAGGLFKIPGDYLYRTQESFQFGGGGLWGIFRVTKSTTRVVAAPQ